MQPSKKKETKTNQRGLGVLLEPYVNHHDHFPVLDIIFERFSHKLTMELHGITLVNVDVTFLETHTVHFGRYLEDLKESSVFGVFHAKEWDNDGLITLNSKMARSLLELMLGGRFTGSPNKKSTAVEPSYTQIERHLLDQLLQNYLDTLQEQISTITPVRLLLSRTEVSSRGLVIVREASPCVVASFKMQIESLSGEFHIVLPYTTIQPVRSIFADAFLGEKMGNDALWVDHIRQELIQTRLSLDVILDEVSVPLRDMMRWKKGSFLHLNVGPDSPVYLTCAGSKVFSARMGQKKGRLALSLEESFLKSRSQDQWQTSEFLEKEPLEGGEKSIKHTEIDPAEINPLASDGRGLEEGVV